MTNCRAIAVLSYRCHLVKGERPWVPAFAGMTGGRKGEGMLHPAPPIWVPACAGMAGMTVPGGNDGARGNDGVVLEGDFCFGFDFVGVDFVAEAGLVGDC